MAAGDFTNSALQVSQVKLMEMFTSPNISQTELNIGSAMSARALLMKQRARTVPRLVGDKCVGVEAWYIRPHAEGTADTTAPNTCATPCGDEAETLKGEYETIVLARSQAKVEDNRCDNLITFGEELAAQQAHMMAKMRQDLNKLVVIPTVAAASQAMVRRTAVADAEIQQIEFGIIFDGIPHGAAAAPAPPLPGPR